MISGNFYSCALHDQVISGHVIHRLHGDGEHHSVPWYYYDAEPEMYYFQSQYYDPIVKMFLNTDSKICGGISFQSANLYSYCYNNPVNMADDGGSSPFGVLVLADYATIHAGVQLDLSIKYSWGLDVFVTGENGNGRLDLYDAENHVYYEVICIVLLHVEDHQNVFVLIFPTNRARLVYQNNTVCTRFCLYDLYFLLIAQFFRIYPMLF